MEWNKINLRKNNSNLPPIGERVLFATKSKDTFIKFIGKITSDGKWIDSGYDVDRLTSDYWWCDISEDPK